MTTTQSNFLAILVLYKTRLVDSATYKSLIASSPLTGIPLAVYDNSPIQQVESDEKHSLFKYRHDPDNAGIAGAYNWGLQHALQCDYPWILLLDQDSKLPESFLRDLTLEISRFGSCDEIAAIVPHIRAERGLVSPTQSKFGRLAVLPVTFDGILSNEVSAINSGALIRTSFIRSLGGFDVAYPLDFLDHWLFHQVSAAGKRVAITTSIIHHDFSVHDYPRKITEGRYRSIISAEARFMLGYKSNIELLVYFCRLLCRSVKQLLVYRQPRLGYLTISTAAKIAVVVLRSVLAIAARLLQTS